MYQCKTARMDQCQLEGFGGGGVGGWGGGGGGAQRPFICFHLLQTSTLIPIPCVGCVCGPAFLSSIFVCVWEVGGSNGLSGMNNSWFFSGLYGWVKMGKRELVALFSLFS